KSDAGCVCDYVAGRLREADGRADDQTGERVRLRGGGRSLRCQLALRRMPLSQSFPGEPTLQTGHGDRTPLSVAAAIAGDRTAGTAGRAQCIWGIALQEENRDRTRPEPTNLLRGRPGSTSSLGSADLEGPKLGLGQA